MESEDLVQWLLRHAGPIIRYRTYVDILKERDVGVVSGALSDVLTSPLVQEWLQKLTPRFDLSSVHSSNSDAYENAMGKLAQLGLRAGLQPFDGKTLPFRIWLTDHLDQPPSQPHSVFLKSIIASFLSYAGYGDISPVSSHLQRRVEALYEFAKEPDFGLIFADKGQFKGIPKKLDEYDLVDPELYPEQQLRLPWIHDIRGLAFCRDIMQKKQLKQQAERTVMMILTEEYQSLPWSYGIVKYGHRYYVLGWAAHLPNYEQRALKERFGELLLCLEMLAPFDCVRQSEWFRNSLRYLEEFRTADGTYKFPRAFLVERGSGYWVKGCRMGLEERRSSAYALECESTFWVLRIKSLAGILQARV